MAVTDEMLAAMAALMPPSHADMVEEAERAYQAASQVDGGDPRELYLAYFRKAHPAPEPIEDGVLQPGDKVMMAGSSGGPQGMGTLVRAYQEDRGVRPITYLEYVLDRPYASPFQSGEKIGGVTHFGALVHARDWPRTMLGDVGIGRDLQVRLGELDAGRPQPDGRPAAGRP